MSVLVVWLVRNGLTSHAPDEGDVTSRRERRKLSVGERMQNSTSRATHHFTCGEIDCIAVCDGSLSYPSEWIFSNVPADQLQRELRDQNASFEWRVLPYLCLVLKTGQHRVLVDTGAAGLAPTTGNLLQNLEKEGIAPDEITVVVLTHGHPDHIGYVLDESGKPAFSNARYIISAAEWNFWLYGPDLRASAIEEHVKQLLVSSAQKNLPPLKKHVELIEGNDEIVPGIYAIPAPGHTPGHLALLISSGTEQLLHVADAVLDPLFLQHPEWRTAFDLSEDHACRTRAALLDRAAAGKALVLGFHFPFPGIGHVSRRGSRWSWEPVLPNPVF